VISFAVAKSVIIARRPPGIQPTPPHHGKDDTTAKMRLRGAARAQISRSILTRRRRPGSKTGDSVANGPDEKGRAPAGRGPNYGDARVPR
jgi:hypothetical protein